MSKNLRRELDPNSILKSRRRIRVPVNYSETRTTPLEPKIKIATKRKAPSKPRAAKPSPSKKVTRQSRSTSQKPSTKRGKTKGDSKAEVDEKDDESENSSSSSSSSDSDDESVASVAEPPDSDPESESEPESESASSEPESDPEDKPARKRRAPAKRTIAKRAPTQRTPAATPKRSKPATAASLGNRTIRRVNTVMPVLPLRNISRKEDTNMSPYARARERLHVSAVPDSLPCREDEFVNIMGYIESAIQESTGTCVYISGVPGTGKTATVLEVIRYLQHQAEEKAIPDFDFVEINGMKLTDPAQAYSILWECMERSSGQTQEDGKKRRYTSAHALQMLEAKFSNHSDDQRTTVVLMDELDLLVTKKQTVMYNFFDWPSRPLSKLIVVAVANTMDLPERIMSNKIASRMGLTRINFQPYKYDQLFQIVQSRLEGIDAFAKEAVEFAARKVSAVSGDARRALDICRRAVEIVEMRSAEQKDGKPAGKHVTIAIVDEAVKEMFSSPSVAFIRSCSLHQKIFLVACMQRSRAIGLAEIEFGDVAHYHIQTCKWHNIEPPNTSDLMRVCESLGQTRALVMEGGRMDICMRLSLNLLEEDIVMACKADKLISRLLKNLPTTDP